MCEYLCLLSLDQQIHDEAGPDLEADDAISFMTRQHTIHLLSLLEEGAANPMVKKSLVVASELEGVALTLVPVLVLS